MAEGHWDPLREELNHLRAAVDDVVEDLRALAARVTALEQRALQDGDT